MDLFGSSYDTLANIGPEGDFRRLPATTTDVINPPVTARDSTPRHGAMQPRIATGRGKWGLAPGKS